MNAKARNPMKSLLSNYHSDTVPRAPDGAAAPRRSKVARSPPDAAHLPAKCQRRPRPPARCPRARLQLPARSGAPPISWRSRGNEASPAKRSPADSLPGNPCSTLAAIVAAPAFPGGRGRDASPPPPADVPSPATKADEDSPSKRESATRSTTPTPNPVSLSGTKLIDVRVIYRVIYTPGN
ncbi:uncharacterized protein LOC126110390 [Schistocerca cancellata]|uniref:uncharacterized protein LOC126110390 n=1 Tax=Schistocerca cancellata TaxID=274614 RepID=UPI0021174C80|nr:uncharacterized protein LOC126110390 [Schistocerca cancellata]